MPYKEITSTVAKPGLIKSPSLSWIRWRSCQKGNDPFLSSLPSSVLSSSCSPFQTDRLLLSSTRLPGHQEAPEGLLASSFQPGLDSCLLHFLPHRGWGEQLRYGVCSHWGLGNSGLRTTQRQMSHSPLPTQVLPSFAAGGTSSHYSPVLR